MSEFKGTKGKWEIACIGEPNPENYNAGYHRISVGGYYTLTDVWFADTFPAKTKTEALYNAKLISCAPDLLEALQHTLEVLYECECPNNLYETYANLFANYNNLIKKATEL